MCCPARTTNPPYQQNQQNFVFGGLNSGVPVGPSPPSSYPTTIVGPSPPSYPTAIVGPSPPSVPINPTQPLFAGPTQPVYPQLPAPPPIATTLLSSNQCGITNFTQTRVVGGGPARLGQYPWIAALGYRNPPSTGYQFNCAGSLITLRHVITSAHCVSSNL